MPCRSLGPALATVELRLRYILDARDNLSGFVEAIALKKKTGRSEADWIENFYLRHPFVRRFIADNETEFVNQEVLGMLKRLCVPIKLIEPYHPETNAPVERGHRTLKNTIAKLAADNLESWHRYLKQTVFSEHMTPKRTMGCIPAELWYGREIDFFVEALIPTWNRLDDDPRMTTEELIEARCQQVLKNEEVMEDIANRVLDSRMRDKARWDQVVEKLREANFKINAKKCEWEKTQVLYSGHVLDGNGIRPEDSKTTAIRDWSTPRTLIELRSFLGLANYYRKFVRSFSTITAPLRRLLKKEAIWKWDRDCTSALKKLKRALIEYLVFKVADLSLPFVVTTDASQYGIGVVLQQDDGNGYRAVEFMSARMPSEKVATSTYERELYALRQILDHWKHYLLRRHFKVYSDHETLRWLKPQAKMTPKFTRWAIEIDQFDFELKPIKGKYNVVADALSRRADYFGAMVHYLDIGRDL
ncbi:hypothetical protein CBR_g60013 [Chara braunii]|uniref:Integrase catalytic domain-containing protein n=1 Tax=Chara braunii TaxID=69332 RepID=A0A388K8H2_CHABU|nr:hypothetical protein CBR_g60013 [Chara braunii]|eukprot:GBG66362.1 hypothetical protein CBR_g60013 [Chara braunii]